MSVEKQNLKQKSVKELQRMLKNKGLVQKGPIKRGDKRGKVIVAELEIL